MNFDTDENVILEIRQHWFIVFTRSLVALFVAALPAIMWSILVAFLPIQPSTLFTLVFRIIYASYLLFIWLGFFTGLVQYSLTYWILTDKRVVASDQRGLFHQQENSIPLENIQDLASSERGIFQTMLGFGHLSLQSAGTVGKFRLNYAKNSRLAREKINDTQRLSLEKVQRVRIIG